MKNKNIEMKILVKGRPITEYPHKDKTYVEGRDASNFEIELINHNGFPSEIILSVDGLSIIDGKDAGPNSSGYLLRGGERLRIPGWKLDASAVAAFQFAGKGKSYAQQSTGSARNTGVIGLMAYDGTGQRHIPSQAYGPSGIVRGPTGAVGPTGPTGSTGYPTSWAGSFPIGTLCSSHGTNTSSVQADPFSIGQFSSGSINSSEVKQTLGTAFGKKQDFNTQTVSFMRGDMIAMMVVYYDDARGLRSRGVDLQRRSTRSTPDAFPAMNCKPPKGWCA